MRVFIWIEYFVNSEKEKKKLGTFKTLYEDNEAMHIMAGLLADFIIEENAYVNAHLDDFTWEGVDVHALDENGERYSRDIPAVIWKQHCTGKMSC